MEKDTKSAENGSKVNGREMDELRVNGVSNKSASSNNNIPPAPLARTNKAKKPPSTWAQYKALKKASQRPLPTKMGDGRYNDAKQRPGLRQDLGSLTMDGQ